MENPKLTPQQIAEIQKDGVESRKRLFAFLVERLGETDLAHSLMSIISFTCQQFSLMCPMTGHAEISERNWATAAELLKRAAREMLRAQAKFGSATLSKKAEASLDDELNAFINKRRFPLTDGPAFNN